MDKIKANTIDDTPNLWLYDTHAYAYYIISCITNYQRGTDKDSKISNRDCSMTNT